MGMDTREEIANYLLNNCFLVGTEDSMRERYYYVLNHEAAFQEIFNLEPDGVVGKATWYKIKQIFAAVKRLSDITGEGLEISEVERRYTRSLRLGDSGVDVEALQYYLAFLGYFFPELPPIPITGYFGEMTRDAVFTFQKLYGLTVDGIAGRQTFGEVERAYKAAVSELPANYQSAIGEPYPGRFLVFGDTGESVTIIQRYLDIISRTDPQIPQVNVTGTFDEAQRGLCAPASARHRAERRHRPRGMEPHHHARQQPVSARIRSLR